MRSYNDIECSCGHKGQISMKENDQPFSTEWSTYSLIGFDGEGFYVEGAQPAFKDIVQRLDPKCPKCGILLASLEGYKI